MEKIIEKVFYASRWLLVPLYAGLIGALLLLIVKFAQEIIHILPTIHTLDESQIVLVVLSFIDMTLIGGLVVMVMFSGYENFVSRFDLGNEQKLSWLGKLDSGSLKQKVSASIVAISSIHLLKSFMNVSQISNDKLLWYVIIHMTFVASAFVMSIMDKMSRDH